MSNRLRKSEPQNDPLEMIGLQRAEHSSSQILNKSEPGSPSASNHEENQHISDIVKCDKDLNIGKYEKQTNIIKCEEELNIVCFGVNEKRLKYSDHSYTLPLCYEYNKSDNRFSSTVSQVCSENVQSYDNNANSEFNSLSLEFVDIDECTKLFKCFICNTHFASKDDLQSHSVVHGITLQFYCSICGKGFINKHELDNHNRTHLVCDRFNNLDQNDLVSCNICSKVCSDRNQLRLHMQSHEINKTFNKKSVFNRHLVKINQTFNSEPIKTNIPNTKEKLNYRCNDDLPILYPKKSRDATFLCFICVEFYQLNKFHSHMKTHSDEDKFSCNACFKVFSNRFRFYLHMRSHTNTAQHFDCDTCDKFFPHKYLLNKHITSQHNGIKNKSSYCDICKKSFTSNKSFDIHRQNCEGMSREFLCDICSKTIVGNLAFNRHVLRHHTVKFKCQFCDKTFSQNWLLQYHLRVHLDVKAFECSECGKCFHSKNNLKVHLQTHSVVKRLQCSVCGKCFGYSSAFRLHYLRNHATEANKQCEICNKTCRSKESLTKHLKSHSTEKPFQCALCGKYLKNRTTMTTHIFSHSKVKPFECFICKNRFTKKCNLKIHMLLHD